MWQHVNLPPRFFFASSSKSFKSSKSLGAVSKLQKNCISKHNSGYALFWDNSLVVNNINISRRCVSQAEIWPVERALEIFRPTGWCVCVCVSLTSLLNRRLSLPSPVVVVVAVGALTHNTRAHTQRWRARTHTHTRVRGMYAAWCACCFFVCTSRAIDRLAVARARCQTMARRSGGRQKRAERSGEGAEGGTAARFESCGPCWLRCEKMGGGN